MKKIKLQIKLFLLIYAISIFFPSKIVNAENNKNPVRYENISDFVCGYTNEDNTTITLSNINIVFHNPNDFPVMLNNFVRLANISNYIEPEYNDRYLNVLISPKRSFEIDCRYIKEMFFEEDIEDIQIVKSFEGLLHSKSIRFLEVAFEFTRYSRSKEKPKLKKEKK